MVYNFPEGAWFKALQLSCLVCGLACRNTQSQPVFGLCHHCHVALPRLMLDHSCALCCEPLSTNQPLQLRCGRCLQQRPYFDHSCSALRYEGIVLNLIDTLKRHYDKAVVRLLCDCFLQQLQSLDDIENQIADIDVIMPCPMYWQRDLKRGLNHSLLLSRYLAYRLQLPHQANLLVRARYSATQRGLNAKQRQQNIQGVFSVKRSVKGLTIAIVDDVMTTGSTLNEASKTLMAAGAEKVYAWSIARTPATRAC